jgi:hypothetical protein
MYFYGKRKSYNAQDSNITCSLCGFEIWSHTLWKAHRLRALQKRVLWRIFGPSRDGVTGGWIKLHKEELRNLYSSQNIISMIRSKRIRWAGHVVLMGK